MTVTRPGLKLDQVSAWKSCTREALGDIVEGLDSTIGFMYTRSVAVKDRLHRPCCAATKMLIPLDQVNKPITGQDDGLGH